MPLTHKNDSAGAERVLLTAARGFDALIGSDLHLLSHVEHPHDPSASITTLMLDERGGAYVVSFLTTRDENGGNVELLNEVHQAHNAAA